MSPASPASSNSWSTTTTTKPTTEAVPLEKLEIYASTYDLQLGDSVKLEYSVKPSNAPAVVGYFCDDEGIIEIGTGGNIKAIGTGKATVVVCANDDLYAQCDFEVTEAVGDVTLVAENTSRKVVGTAVSEMTTQPQDTQSFLTKLGINVNQLSQNPGMARHMDYDSVILGSSMTVNFDTRTFADELGLDTIKLPYSGAYPKDISNIMSVIFESHPDVDTVFLGIDVINYSSDVDFTLSGDVTIEQFVAIWYAVKYCW